MIELWGFSVPNPYHFMLFFAVMYLFLTIICLLRKRICLSRFSWSATGLVFFMSLVWLLNIPELCKIGYESRRILVDGSSLIIGIGGFLTLSDSCIMGIVHKHRKVAICGLGVILFMPMVISFYLSGSPAGAMNLRGSVYNFARGIGHGVSYQSYGDSVVLYTFFISSWLQKNWQRWLLTLMMFFALIVVGSKAPFLGVCVALSATWGWHLIRKFRLVLVYGALCGVLLALCSLWAAWNGYLGNSWLSYSLRAGITDSSFKTREALTELNATGRESRILLGDYAYVIRVGRPGGYEHNIFDWFNRYGMVGGLWYSFLLLWAGWMCFRKPLRQELLQERQILCFCFWLPLALLIRSSMSFPSHMTYLAGAVASEKCELPRKALDAYVK